MQPLVFKRTDKIKHFQEAAFYSICGEFTEKISKNLNVKKEKIQMFAFHKDIKVSLTS